MSTFSGSIMQGDPAEDQTIVIGDVTFDAEISTGAPEPTLEGAIAAAATAVKKSITVPIKASPAASGPAVQAAKAIATTAAKAATSIPGNLLQSAKLSPFIVSNARIISKGTNQLVSGFLLKHNLERALSLCTFPSYIESASSSGGSFTSAVFGNTSITSPASVATKGDRPWLIPIVFITIVASPLNTLAGQRITFKALTAFDEFGVALNLATDEWVIERTNVSAPIQIAYIPYYRVKDTIKPVVAMAFKCINPNEKLVAAAGSFVVGSLAGLAPSTFSFSLTGLNANSDTVQVVYPGLDSTELASFMKTWGLAL